MIIGFAGLIGTGKSELSSRVAITLGWPRASFGDYIRSIARQRNIEQTRRNLQNLGEAIIFEQGWDHYCLSVLAQVHWKTGQSVVLDGLRHSEALYALRQIAYPTEVKLVLLELDESLRRSRVRARDGQVHDDMEELEAHSTEIQVAGILKMLADFVLDSSRALDDLSSIVVEWIRELNTHTR